MKNRKRYFKVLKSMLNRWVNAFSFPGPLWYEKFGWKFVYNYFKIRTFFTNKSVIPFVDYKVTTFCTLKCKDCNHFIPYYKKDGHIKTVDFDIFKQEIDKFLKKIDLLYILSFSGGECLLNKDLAKMIEYAKKKKKIQHILFTSNATILPDENLIKVIKKTDTLVVLSDYSKSPDIKNLHFKDWIKIIQQNKIKYRVYDYKCWDSIQKPKDIEKYTKNSQLAEKNFNKCGLKNCQTYSEGNLHLCPISLFILKNVKNFKDYDNEILNVKDVDNADIFAFYAKNYFELCSYCDFSELHEVTPAIQIKNSNRKD